MTTTTRTTVTLPKLHAMRQSGEKITMLTAYDATFAGIASTAGVDCLLVGDSLGMVCQGQTSTVGVSLEAMRYHTACVSHHKNTALVVSDLPFGSYQSSKERALQSAVILMQAGAHMVKLEGGGWTTETVEFLTTRGIPVCAHLGLTPQTIHALGGYKVQGKSTTQAIELKNHAHQLQDAGASLLVLEMVPCMLAKDITNSLQHCHTIGIGAGKDTAGQVLVLHDMLGMNLGKNARFVRDFLQDSPEKSIHSAIAAYVHAVKNGTFPDNILHAW